MIEHAKSLLRHQNPSGELAVIIERGLALLIAELEKKKLGKTKHPHRARPAQHGAVTRAARREVFGRDGLQCAYVDAASGRRCEGSAFLEVDHVAPRARGGSAEPENLRVLCRAHNRLHAEDTYGQKLIHDHIHFRQRKRAPEPPRKSAKIGTSEWESRSVPHSDCRDRSEI
jgi:5-methylcytosine-specific restriction endonuclease McrA